MELFLAIVGTLVTIAVIAGMVLLVPRGVEPVRRTPDEPADPQGDQLSPRRAAR